MPKNSSKPKSPRNLADVSSARAKRFLLELANLSDDRLTDNGRQAVAIFEKRFAEIIPVKWLTFRNEPSLPSTGISSGLLGLIDERIRLYSTPSFRAALRAIWIAPDYRTKEWGVFRLIESAMITEANSINGIEPATLNIVEGRVLPLPSPTPLEQCLRYLLRNTNKTVFCSHSECPAPFFFGSRKSQKYCSTVCALPAQRKFKREWWSKNGKEWRTRRESKKR
jgi:hypothetical protein